MNATIVDRTFQGLTGEEVNLFQTVLRDKVGLGVEIGCLDGFSSTVILAASSLTLVSIDPFVPDSMEKSLIGNLERFKANTAPFASRSRLLKDFSQNVAPTWTQALDFLFIDGDHTKEAVLRDYNQWTPFLKVGGILAIHDSRMFRPGGAPFHVGPSEVARDQVYANSRQWEIVGEAFSLTVARRMA